MLKFIASLSLAALLSLSPAFAHEDGPTAAPKTCHPSAEVLKTIPLKPISQISKPEDVATYVANFNDYIGKNGGPKAILGNDVDQVIIFPRNVPDSVMYVTFTGGCAKTMGTFPVEILDDLAGVKKPAPPAAPVPQFQSDPGPKVGHPMSPDDGKI